MELVASGIAVPSVDPLGTRYHWMVAAGRPEATTVKVALSPAFTETDAGSVAMTGDDFSLDINNPREPKVLVVGNNPDRQNIYSAALGLYNSRIVKLINKKKQLKSSVIIDELPTIYFRGLDNLIATARSNKVAVCLGFQDFSQLTRDYGDKESKVIQNTKVDGR